MCLLTFSPSRYSLFGGEGNCEFLSREGTTQGCPLGLRTRSRSPLSSSVCNCSASKFVRRRCHGLRQASGDEHGPRLWRLPQTFQVYTGGQTLPPGSCEESFQRFRSTGPHRGLEGFRSQ